tara:strand:- start:719 stop:1051 length:333 start_codon:yes stop_codon:yes gene_type:complete
MDKFLKLYVTAADLTAGYRYVSLNDILEVVQASTTTVTVTYRNAVAASDVLTITHDAIATNAYTMRDWFTDNMVNAMRQSWQQPAASTSSPLPDNAAASAAVTITGIAIA